MGLQINRVQVWATEIPDRPGAALVQLEQLGQSGADLEYIFTRLHPNRPDMSVIYVAPITGQDQIRAARAAGFGPALDVAMLRVEGENRGNMRYNIMSCLAVAGINLRGLSVSAVGPSFTAYLAFDNADVATQALQILATIG